MSNIEVRFNMSITVKEEFNRTALVLGEKAIEKLASAKVAVFGVGGVGGYVCEALARSGVGSIDLFDADCVSLSNINRQIIALHSTVGEAKVDVMFRRILDINPDCRVNTHKIFYSPENADEFDLSSYDYIADAIDSLKSKIELVARACSVGVPIISSMGAANKTDPTGFMIANISKTEYDPLARIMRRELRKRGIDHFNVVYSREIPVKPEQTSDDGQRITLGSLSFVPSAAGLVMASKIVKDIISENGTRN